MVDPAEIILGDTGGAALPEPLWLTMGMCLWEDAELEQQFPVSISHPSERYHQYEKA